MSSRDMQDPGGFRSGFIRMMQRPEPEIELARAALLVAAESAPALDVEAHLDQLAAWAETLQARFEPDWNNLQKLARLRAFAFEELGFLGDDRDYHSPRNSLLHEVLRRRRGVPLTLAIVLLELGWRVGIPFEGVGFPGHFLVRLTGEPRDLLLDPYRHARTVHEEDCRRILREVAGGRLAYEPGLVASVGKREMIARLLRNLKGAYARTGEDALALAAVDRLLILAPGDHAELRDRGLLLARLGHWRPALDSLLTCLERAPGAADRAEIEGEVAALRGLISSLN